MSPCNRLTSAGNLQRAAKSEAHTETNLNVKSEDEKWRDSPFRTFYILEFAVFGFRSVTGKMQEIYSGLELVLGHHSQAILKILA